MLQERRRGRRERCRPGRSERRHRLAQRNIATHKQWHAQETDFMGLKRATSCSIWRTAFLVSALTVLAGTAAPDGVCAEGLFDFLFGGFQRPSPPPDAPPPTPTVGRVAPPALGHESVSGNSSIGRSVGFCVRLCDGQHFPIGQIVYGTPEDTCTAICPYSKTKLCGLSRRAGSHHQRCCIG
jgi:Protein of unknown function (DUF2865)